MNFVPSTRLLWLIGAILVVATVAGPLPELTSLWVGLFAAALLLALVDLALSLRGVSALEIRIPVVVRFAKDRPGVIPVTLGVAGLPVARLRFALGLPGSFASAHDDVAVDLPPGAAHVRFDWPTTAGARGVFAGLTAAAEWTSRLGLWEIRRRQAVDGELRVYPNLLTERKQLAALFLSRGQLGAKLQRTVGRGREFEKLRDYLPGDGFDEIHWKATAKRGRPITKVFQAERTQEIFVLIDASRLSARPVVHEGQTVTALERYLTAALILLLAAERTGDRFGLLVYDDRVRVFVKAAAGEAHYAACREALHHLCSSAATPDMAEVVRYVRTQLRRRALLVFLTDLTDPVLAEDFGRHVGLLARQHLIFVNQLRSLEVAPLFAGDPVAAAAEIPTRLAGHLRWQELQAGMRRSKSAGITAALLDDEKFAAELVSQYLAVKQRQAL